MRQIRKTHPPQAFLNWLTANKELDCSYGALVGRPAHIELKQSLIREQGFLCAYTGREILEVSSHVEHLKPQSRCTGNEDVEYRNVVACFPANGGDTSHGYGAPVKGDWWEEALFVSPLSADCERRFIFSWSGKIAPNPKDHQGAQETIKVLKLDHDNLVHLRRKAIQGFFGFGSAKPLSKQEARRLLVTMDRPNAVGKLTPFCFVLKPLLEKHSA
jgi:uncharacterized protein (TIGR02646 family)